MTFSKSQSAGPLRILIVDRDRPVAEALADGIAPLLPVRPDIVVVGSGRSGNDTLRAGTFDIAALDLMSIGDLGGSAEDGMARLVKLSGAALAIALCQDGSVSTALAAMRAGAHDAIQKPVNGATFVGRVAALAQRHGRVWTMAVDPSPAGDADMAMMLSGAGAALRAAAEPPKRTQVIPMWQQEQRIIEDAIASFAGNITLAAQALELNPSTIYRKRQAWAEMESGAKGAA